MSVRSSLPWPLRWIAGALMLGFSGAIASWAFEFGKGITGTDTSSKEELVLLRQEVGQACARTATRPSPSPTLRAAC